MAVLQRIDISSGTIWRTVIILTVLWFMWLMRDFLLLLFGAVIFSAAISPVADYLERFRVPRALSVAVVYAVLIGLLSLVVTLMIPPFIEQSQQLIEALPQIVERLEQWSVVAVPEGTREEVVHSVETGLRQFVNQLGGLGVNVFQQTVLVFRGIFSFFFFLVIAFYLTAERDALKKIARVTVPKRYLAYVESRIDRMKQRIGLWVVGQMSLAVIMGVLSGVGLWLLGVKYALVLGIVAGILELLPVMGPILSGTLAVTLTLTQSLWLGVTVLVFYVVIQQLESGLLVPNIMKRTTGLHPLVVILAVLLGARLVGVVGVIMAVPTATIVVMLWQDLFAPASSIDPAKGSSR